MKNLNLVAHCEFRFPVADDGNARIPQAWCVKSARSSASTDFGESSIVSAVPDSPSSIRIVDIEFNCGEVIMKESSKSVNEFDSITDVVAVQSTWEGLVLVLKNGAILSVVGEECSLCVPANGALVLSAVPSPDGDLIVVADSNATLRFIECNSWSEIRQCNLGIEADLQTNDAFVSVGWGNEETQFRGSGVARARREGKLKSENGPSTTHPSDDGEIYICWRGDGDFVAVSHLAAAGGRVLRVFDREGNHLHSSSPGVLERCVAWQPSGSVIASTKHVQDKLRVVLFEKNCLPWHHFDLLGGNPECAFVQAMEWSPTSDVLALALSAPDTMVTVQLWTRSNYQWDLKFSISSEQNLRAMLWTKESNYKLHVVFDSSCDLYEFVRAVCASNDQKDAWVAVVNGSNLRLTPLGKRVFPPPMCAQELAIEKPVVGAVFAISGTGLFCVTEDSIHHYDVSSKNGTKDLFVLLNEYRLRSVAQGDGEHPTIDDGKTGLSKLSSWVAVGVNQLVARTGSVPVLFELDGSCSDLQGSIIHAESVGNIRDICGADGQLLLVNTSNEVFKCVVASKVICSTGKKLGAQCAITLFDSTRDLLIGLASSAGKLFCYEWEIMRGASSIRLHAGKFLLVTTSGSDSWLWCFKLDRIASEYSLAHRRCGLEELGVRRRAENGATIVTSCVETSAVIFQMPRGNLETVYPRELLLSCIAEWLDNREYSLAYLAMRRHRISLNILCDHDSSLFLENLDKFVSEILPEYLAQFLLDLIPEDVTTTLYRGFYGQNRISTWRATLAAIHPTTKIDAICRSLREAMLNYDKSKLMRPILASFARETVPELDSALIFLTKFEDEKAIDDGIRYLMYLVDPDALFDVALGTYDLKLAIMVAERSQKDPKEWVAFLEQFGKHKTPFMEYQIDLHLKRWHSALKHLAECYKIDPKYEEECLKLINEKGLFQAGMEFFAKDSNLHRRVCKLYGDKLSLSGRNDEAGLIYLIGDLTDDAARAFALAGEEALCAKAASHLTSEQKAEIGRILANALANKREYRSAARIVVDWCDDVNSGASYLFEGHHWISALQLTMKPDEVLIKLLGFVEELEKSFCETKTEVPARTERLVVVFGMKFDEVMASGDGDNFPDVISETETTGSEASSAISQSSNRSLRSMARKKKKEERKSRSLREGSRTEDIALVMWLHSAISGAIETKVDVRETLVQLVAMGQFNRARQLQESFKSVLHVVSSACCKIWPFWLNLPNLGLDDSNLSTPQSGHLGPAASTADAVAAFAQTASYRKFVRSRFMFMDPSVRFAPNPKNDFVWSLSVLADEERDRGVRVRGRDDYGFV